MVRILPETVQKLISFAEASIKRCYTFTVGFSTCDLIDALNDYFSGITSRLGAILLQVRIETDLDETTVSASMTGEDGIYDRRSSAGEDDYEIGRDELGRQEWNHFQMGLRILNASLMLIKKVDSFQDSIATMLKETLPYVDVDTSVASSDPKGTCSASLLSLKLSSLNSMKLSRLCHEIALGPSSPTLPSSPNHPDLPKEKVLLKSGAESLQSFSIKAQKYIYDSMFAAMNRKLKILPYMEVWSSSRESDSPFDIALPQFSLSPLDYATRIGEHLLSLPQQLDLYIDDESLAYSIKTLPFMETFQIPETSEDLDITHLWLTSVCRGIMDSFVVNALEIPEMSPHGSLQLLTDMQYLVNVFSAMEIDPLEPFSLLMDSLKLSKTQIQEQLQTVKEEWIKEILKKLESKK